MSTSVTAEAVDAIVLQIGYVEQPIPESPSTQNDDGERGMV